MLMFVRGKKLVKLRNLNSKDQLELTPFLILFVFFNNIFYILIYLFLSIIIYRFDWNIIFYYIISF